MRCGRVRKKLMAYHDEELSGSERTRMEEHLTGCPICSGMLEDLVRADSAAGLPGPGPQYWDSFTDRVMASVKEEPVPARMGQEKHKKKTGPAFLRFVPALSVALVFVVAMGLYLGGRVRIPPGSDVAFEKARKAGPAPPVPSVQMDKAEMKSGVDRNEASAQKATELKEKGAVQVATPALEPEKRKADARAPAAMVSETAVSDEVAEESFYKAKAAAVIPASALFAQAESSFRAGDLSGSETLLRRLLVEYPADPIGVKTTLLLARVLDGQGRIHEAEKVLSEGERMFPGDADLAGFRREMGARPDGTMGQ